ncbi:hypothetical protein [Ruegeria sp. 6PALISEP08]|uniref:hypothetical protein n=1 Tax=Ruegeria sp. 6PALISEP08 TaxID=1225660 RepID=UPI00067EE392|nr:hypothetical protein [Ruegeria sp. 6PALISEP08]
MARIVNPILFSSYFGVNPAEIDKAGLIDPFLNVDLELFIDPVLLEKSGHPLIAKDAIAVFRDHFSKIVRLLTISQAEDDVAWLAARRLLNLEEPSENGLGYGGASRSGSSRPEEIQSMILRTTKEIITLGANDPEMISLMGFFEEGVGPDTISDFTTRVVFLQLATITSEFCNSHALATTPISEERQDIGLPHFVDSKGTSKPFLLVPKDIVRDLPIANDWSDVREAAMKNAEIRNRVSQLLAGITEPTVTDTKHALRGAALSSADAFNHFLASVKDNASNYDPIEDALGYYRYRQLLLADPDALSAPSKVDLSTGPEAIRAVVHEAIALFKQHVEVGDLWRELWVDGKPKKERAAQLMFQAIADAFCKANNIDMSPETNMGGGPVDFKFSKGYEARVLVELKRDSGTVRHGYETQLEHYKEASETFFGIFVVIDYGKLGDKLDTINEIRKVQLLAGERASDIVVIDATPKKSASKK